MKNLPLYFEDFKIGMSIKTQPKKITKEEIINFAKSYDPQSFHIDEEEAKKGPQENKGKKQRKNSRREEKRKKENKGRT